MKSNYSMRRLRVAMYSMLTVLTIISCVLLPMYFNSYASDENGGKEEVEEEFDKYQGDDEYTHEILGRFNDEIPKEREPSFKYLYSRVFIPGYVYNVENAVLGNKTEKNLIKNGLACDPNEPQNLVSANCAIPNFSTQLFQSVFRVISPGGIINGERDSAQPMFAWGVPDNIPGGSVPVDEAQRVHKYTGLEAYGYNVKFTDYRGEWDDVIPSTEARLMANFGFMDTINLTGTTIWNGISTGTAELVENITWNPKTWIGSIIGAFEAGTADSMLTIVDSSEANIVTTRAWVRSGTSVGGSFYNVKVLSDKEIMEVTGAKVARRFADKLNIKLNGSSELAKVLAMQEPPKFTYDPNKETEASKKARANAEEKNRQIRAENERTKAYNANLKEGEKPRPLRDLVEIPNKEFVPESEQLQDWYKKDSGVAEGNNVGINCTDSTTYADFQGCWQEKWSAYQKREFQADSAVVKELLDETEKELFEDDPFSDVTKAISHYVCADEFGNPIKNGAEYQYVFTDHNQGAKENLNANCKPVRPTIKGGYFGTGFGTNTDDTRHISYYKNQSIFALIPIIGDLDKKIQNGALTVSKFNAQLLNELMNLAFSPLMEKLGITTIVKSSIKSFRDSIFYPLVAAVVSLAGLMMFIDVVRNKSYRQFLTSFTTMLLIFFIGGVILYNPDKVVNFMDTIPNKAEQYLTNTILSDSEPNGICATSSKDKNSGTRSSQCHVWNTLVYQPWVYGQFGTGPDELNAKGYAKEGTSEFKNSNKQLVGNATVNLGGGKVLHSWPLWQVKSMTSGTITTRDDKNPVGRLDSNLYKLVDAQAGPKNGQGTDGRFMSSWSGEDGNRTSTAIMAAFLSFFMLFVVGGMLLLKVELTLVFSLLLLASPFMLLAGLTPRGKFKLVGYGATLLTLFIKRLLSTLMIALMLLLLNISVPNNSGGYGSIFIGSLVILGFFLLYKKEILKLFNLESQYMFDSTGTLSNTEVLREKVFDQMPRSVKNRAFMAKESIKGTASGYVGGATGGISATLKEYKDKNSELSQESPSKVFGAMVKNVQSGTSSSNVQRARQASFNRGENKVLRNEGLDKLSIKRKVEEQVRKESAAQITNEYGGLENKVYEEAMAMRKETPVGEKSSHSKSLKEKELDSKTQKAIRQTASEIRKSMAVTDVETTEFIEREGSYDKTIEIASRLDKNKSKTQMKEKIQHPIRRGLDTQYETNETEVATDVSEYIENFEQNREFVKEKTKEKSVKESITKEVQLDNPSENLTERSETPNTQKESGREELVTRDREPQVETREPQIEAIEPKVEARESKEETRENVERQKENLKEMTEILTEGQSTEKTRTNKSDLETDGTEPHVQTESSEKPIIKEKAEHKESKDVRAENVTTDNDNRTREKVTLEKPKVKSKVKSEVKSKEKVEKENKKETKTDSKEKTSLKKPTIKTRKSLDEIKQELPSNETRNFKARNSEKDSVPSDENLDLTKEKTKDFDIEDNNKRS